MFTKRGSTGPKTPSQPDLSSTPSSTPPATPAQIPFVNPPLPSGPEEPPFPVTEEKVLEDPTWAENQLHAGLTVRAMKWLEFLKADETLNPQPGQRLVTLDTQVQMFKVISEWLKTSKRTKEAGALEEGAPGIEMMRQAIREEMAVLSEPKPKAAPKKPPPSNDENWAASEPPATPFERRKKSGTSPYAGADDSQLAKALSRAREAALREP